MKDFILQCYEDYKKFMNIEQNILPDINPVQENIYEESNGKLPYAHINVDEIGSNPINLYYSPQLLNNCHKSFQKAILYHEFTHIYDGAKFSPDYSGKDLSAIMATYSEFHAAQIELACKVGFRSIHSCYKMNLSKTFVYSESQKVKIETDCIYPASDALAILDEPNNSYSNLSEYDYFLNYKTFEVKTMYYLGKNNFCKKYSLKKIPDLTQEWYGEFYLFIHNIEEDIISKNYTSLILDRKKLWEKYISYFPYKQIDSLLEKLNTI